MSEEEVDLFLDSRPGWLALTTISKDGYPHTVPIGYFRLGDDIYIGCRAGTQKLKNIERNPRVSCLVEAGTSMQDIRGVMIQGDAEVYTDPENVLRLTREAAKKSGAPADQLPTQARPGAAYIRVRRGKVVSWDYRG
jgi:nitroimidazol reductase NimA-like FMN-containing flavoprotein (pyridoxamine 5'-phosphate oxidase superfamily)